MQRELETVPKIYSTVNISGLRVISMAGFPLAIEIQAGRPSQGVASSKMTFPDIVLRFASGMRVRWTVVSRYPEEAVGQRGHVS